MAEPGNKKIFVKIKWHQQAVCLLLETIFASVLYKKRTVKTYQALAPPGALVAKPSNQHKSAPGGAAIVSVHLPGVDGNDGGSQDIWAKQKIRENKIGQK